MYTRRCPECGSENIANPITGEAECPDHELVNEWGWLIEQYIAGRGVWWRGVSNCGRTWTTESSEAIRFARKVDAEKCIRAMQRFDNFLQGATVTEHGWTGFRPKSTP